MYVGVDVGGTKTLVAVLDDHGVIKEKKQFPTPKAYEHWLLELKNVAKHLEHQEFKAGGTGMPGFIDRQHGRVSRIGNLPWRNVNAVYDLEKVFGCPFVIENDAKMAALSEYMLIKDKYERVLYVTISTGIGYALVNRGVIDTSVGDGGGRAILLPHQGKLTPWEDFASGHAIVARYGKRAVDINDAATWKHVSRDLAQGLLELVAILEPEAIVVGGSVGVYFDRYKKLLAAELKKHELPLVEMPRLRQAQRPEEAVIYGCYDLAKQVFAHATAN
jgi:glucokinase